MQCLSLHRKYEQRFGMNSNYLKTAYITVTYYLINSTKYVSHYCHTNNNQSNNQIWCHPGNSYY